MVCKTFAEADDACSPYGFIYSNRDTLLGAACWRRKAVEGSPKWVDSFDVPFLFKPQNRTHISIATAPIIHLASLQTPPPKRRHKLTGLEDPVCPIDPDVWPSTLAMVANSWRFRCGVTTGPEVFPVSKPGDLEHNVQSGLRSKPPKNGWGGGSGWLGFAFLPTSWKWISSPKGSSLPNRLLPASMISGGRVKSGNPREKQREFSFGLL